MTDRPTPTLGYRTAPPARRVRFIVWIVCVATLIGGTIGWLFLLRGHRILQNDPILIGGWALLGIGVIAIAVLLRTTPPDAIRLSSRASRIIILGSAIGFQACAVVAVAPVLTEDMHRYMADGLTWLRGRSPYALSPAQFAAQEDAALARTPHPSMHSVYPPTAQGFFVAVSALDSEREQYWYAPALRLLIDSRHFRLLRAANALFAIASIAVLRSILARAGRSPWYAVLLGWNPLFVMETGGMGHVDIVGVLFVLLTIRALQSNRGNLAAGMLALAAGVKPPVSLLAPFLFRDARSRPGWKIPLAFVAFLALVYSPLLIQRGYEGWLRTSRIYATSWEANGSIYELIKWTADPNDGVAVQNAKDRARLLSAIAVIGTIVAAWLLRADLATGGYWVTLVALLTAPVVYPWYLLWVLCLVPLLSGWGGMTALVWSATIPLSYLLWRSTDWTLPAWVMWTQYAPVYLTLVIELMLVARARRFIARSDSAAPAASLQNAVR